MSNLVLDEVTVEKTKKKSEFRLNSQQIFLTYSQCDLLPANILEFLNGKVVIDKYIIAQENHKDGNKHIHAYILLSKKINIRDARYFDIKEFHPKVEGCRSWKNVVKYVTKDGNYISNYDSDVLKRLINDNMKVGELYEKARELAKDGKVKEGVAVLEHSKTVRDLVIHGNAIQKNLRALAVKRRAPDFSIDDFDLNFEWDRTKSLVLWGPTNTGKTSIAKALLPRALFVTHKDRLKEYDEDEYEGLIFDDMSFKHWPREAQIHIVDYDNDRQIDVKHGMAVIPAKTPRIFTTNMMPAEIMLANDGAIERRIQIVFIDKRMTRRRIDIDDVLVDSAFDWVAERNRNRQNEFRSGEEEEMDLHQIQVGASHLASGAEEVQP